MDNRNISAKPRMAEGEKYNLNSTYGKTSYKVRNVGIAPSACIEGNGNRY